MRLRLKLNTIKKTEFKLSAEAVDTIAVEVEQFLRALSFERANILRIRLSVEEALLCWLDHFGEGKPVFFSLGTRWRVPVIVLDLAGEAYDPTAAAGNDLNAWSATLLSDIGLAPQYAYQRGINTLLFRLRRPRRNPALNMLIAIVVGLTLGLLGRGFLPETIQGVLIQTTLDPIRDVFFRIMNAMAGPVIFLTVLVSVCGVGSLTAGVKTGRKMLLRLITVTSLLAVLALFLSIPVFSIRFQSGGMSDGFASVLDFFLNIIPNDILSPLITGDGAQIILMAVILANAILVAGSQSEGLKSLMEQLNNASLVIANWVGMLSPFFIVVLLILGMWSGSMELVRGCWRPFLLFLVMTAAAILGWLLWVSRSRKVPFSLLVKKLTPSFLVALRTASVDAAVGENLLCCEKKLGISEELATYGLPMGLVIYMPASTLGTLLFTVYAAKYYEIVISPVWCITVTALTVALLSASPPVTGVNLLAYSAIFTWLEIPSDGLMIALLADVLFGFFTAAANQAMLQLDLVIQADRMGYLNRDILRKK